MRLDPMSLKLFLSVIKEGTIAAAAEREHIAAAAISKRLSEIEHILGIQLLVRTNRGVIPTDAGIALSSLARRAIHEFDDIFVQMQEYGSGLRGHVRIFANISAITQFLPREIKSFLEKYPHVNVHLEEKISSVITKAIEENSTDIGIFTQEPSVFHELEIFPYHSDRLALIMAKNHPLSKRTHIPFIDTLEFDYVGLHTGSAINNLLIRAANEVNRSVKMRIQVTSYDALCMMVDSALGIGIMPEQVARQYTKTLNIRAIPLTEAWAMRELKIGVRSLEALPAAAQHLVWHLQNTALPDAARSSAKNRR